MAEYNEVTITRILNPTSIDLGEYVINPFSGCEFSCLYCYVRSNRVVTRRNKPWGEYVDVRVNAPLLLKKEIQVKKPKTVLLGSTTECFQPIERKYRITEKLLEILNKHGIYYVILTRSPEIIEYIPLLKKGFCKRIYFTVNKFSPAFKAKLEPKSPGFESRDKAVQELLNAGLAVVPYFSPLLPWISDIKEIFSKFKKAELIEFECLNFRMSNIDQIIDAIAGIDISLKEKYDRISCDAKFYDGTWEGIKRDINIQAEESKKGYNIYTHSFGDYFKNNYDKI
jgi:DNA repair photolyase